MLPENTEFKPGDTVTIQFHDLLSPKEKLSGVYNHNFAVYYQDANGKTYQSSAGGWAGVCDFSGNPARQKLTITIPEDVTDVAYVLNGAIKVGGFGGIPTHRGVSYTKGMDRQWGTSAASVLSQLPELTIKMTGLRRGPGGEEDRCHWRRDPEQRRSHHRRTGGLRGPDRGAEEPGQQL